MLNFLKIYLGIETQAQTIKKRHNKLLQIIGPEGPIDIQHQDLWSIALNAFQKDQPLKIELSDKLLQQPCWTKVTIPINMDSALAIKKRLYPRNSKLRSEIAVRKKEIEGLLYRLLDIVDQLEDFEPDIPYIVDMIMDPYITPDPYVAPIDDPVVDDFLYIAERYGSSDARSLVDRLYTSVYKLKEVYSVHKERSLALHILEKLYSILNDRSAKLYENSSDRWGEMYWYYLTPREREHYQNITALLKLKNGIIIFIDGLRHVFIKDNDYVKIGLSSKHKIWTTIFKFNVNRPLDKIMTDKYIDYENNNYETGPVLQKQFFKVQLKSKIPIDF